MTCGVRIALLAVLIQVYCNELSGGNATNAYDYTNKLVDSLAYNFVDTVLKAWTAHQNRGLRHVPGLRASRQGLLGAALPWRVRRVPRRMSVPLRSRSNSVNAGTLSSTTPSNISAKLSTSRPRLINLEGGVTRMFVQCECSKCQGLVMCGDRELLPSTVTPKRYDLHLSLPSDFFEGAEHFEYDGEMRVALEVSEPCNAITFHAKELQILSGVLVDATGSERTNPGGPDILYGTKEQETATVALAKPLTHEHVGTLVTLTLKFRGVLNDKLAGLYRSAYTNEGEDKQKFLAVTQMEPTDARRAFPCWDEPSLKAVFGVSVTVPTDRVALGNQPEIKREINGNRKTVTFADTPLMSTYLVALVVGEFEALEGRTQEGVLVRCWTPRGQAKQGQFALETGEKALSFFGKYFDNPYPMEKIDMVAVPDFSAGAMENWGLVTYRSSLLLCDESTPTNVKQRIGYVVGHELAHQWFGNLVTMTWWSELWLNEGFATWVGWRAMDEIYPEWRVWSQFLVNEQAMGLGLDSLASSHPVDVPIKSAAQVSEIFDAISYSKGACVIRMLESYLGEESFRTGMRMYVKKHAYGNAQTTDLWSALSEASGKDVKALMDCWTTQMGYPVLTVSSDGTITQSRYLATGPEAAATEMAKSPDLNKPWIVPLRCDGVPDALTQASMVCPLPASAKLNSGQTGFYRTIYKDPVKRKALATAVPSMAEEDRVGFVSDSFATAAAGYTSTVSALELLDSYKSEKSFVVWNEISTGLASVYSALFEQPDETRDALRAYCASLYGPVAASVGFEKRPTDGHADGLFRQLVVGRAIAYREQVAQDEALKRWAAFQSGDADAILPDLRGAIYAAALRAGGVKVLEELKQLYREAAGNAALESIILGSMGAGETEDLVIAALEFNLGNEVRMQDGAAIIGSCAANQKGRRATWEWVKANWDRLEAKFGGGGVSSTLTRIVGASFGSLASAADADDAEKFFGSKATPGIERTVAQSCEAVRARAARVKRDAVPVATWLRSKSL